MNELPVDLLRKVVKYVPETGQLVWAELDASCYPNAQTPEIAAQRATTFNKMYAGLPVTVRRNANKARYVYLRFISQVANISADRLLWLAISGDLTDHVLYYKDGNVENTKLDNITLTHPLAKQALLDPTTGIKQYKAKDETLYRALIYKNADVPRCIKSEFKTATEAYNWRVEYLKEHNAFWFVNATDAYESNPYK